MKVKFLKRAVAGLAISAAVISATATVASAAADGRVTVRVEGAGKTVLARHGVRIRSGWVVKGGHGRNVCPMASAQGALDEATRGRWSGRWYASYGEWEINRIRGVRPRSSSKWWELFVNGRPSQLGACQQKLGPGDRILFALVSGNGENALGVRMPHTVAKRTTFLTRVFYYDSAGHHHPLAGATVRFAGQRVMTGRRGYARLQSGAAGHRRLRAYRRGYVRTEASIRVG